VEAQERPAREAVLALSEPLAPRGVTGRFFAFFPPPLRRLRIPREFRLSAGFFALTPERHP